MEGDTITCYNTDCESFKTCSRQLLINKKNGSSRWQKCQVNPKISFRVYRGRKGKVKKIHFRN